MYNNLDQIKGVYADISNIDIVYKHLLAIEIVARGIKILEVFTANLETYKSLLEMKDDLKVIVANMADVTKAIEVYKDLPNKIAEFKSDLENTKANDMLGQIAHALLPLENALMKMQVDMSNFKLDVNTKLTEMANSFSEKLLALKAEKDKELEAIKAEMLHIKETYIGHQIVNTITTTNTETTNVTKDVKATATNTTTETKNTTATINGDIKADIVANVTGKGGTTPAPTPTPGEDEGNGAEI